MTAPTPSTAPADGASKTVVGLAMSDPQFSTLVKAVQEAGLVQTLEGPGPYTVFAPTDAAFAKIPKDQLDAILADKAKLTKVLTYHVLASRVPSSALQPQQSVPTVEGSPVDIKVATAGATINDANIVKTDIEASNGVIHVIDTVLVPPNL